MDARLLDYYNRELRHLRESQGLRLDEAARRVGVALPALARIERGKATAKPACLRALLDLYGVGILEQRRAMAEMAGDRRRRDWWAFSQETLPSGQSIRAHVEAEASSLRTYQSQVIHELVQTEDYARDAITAANPKRTPEETDRLIALRMQRQKLLVHPEPLRLWIILDESAIRRPARSPGAMRGQLIHLKEVSQLPNVTLQVLSFSAGLHPALNGSFTIIEFPGALDPDIVCCEAPGGLFVMDERETVVRGRAAVFDHLRAAALPPGISADLISDAGRYC